MLGKALQPLIWCWFYLLVDQKLHMKKKSSYSSRIWFNNFNFFTLCNCPFQVLNNQVLCICIFHQVVIQLPLWILSLGSNIWCQKSDCFSNQGCSSILVSWVPLPLPTERLQFLPLPSLPWYKYRFEAEFLPLQVKIGKYRQSGRAPRHHAVYK